MVSGFGGKEEVALPGAGEVDPGPAREGSEEENIIKRFISGSRQDRILAGYFSPKEESNEILRYLHISAIAK